jgi:hypothetical protein
VLFLVQLEASLSLTSLEKRTSGKEQRERMSVHASYTSYAAYAPLPFSFIRFLQSYLREHPCAEGVAFTQVRASLTSLIIEAATSGKLDTSWLIRQLTEVAPANVHITREPLRLWRNKGALREITQEHPDMHSALALLMARRLHRGVRLAPPLISANEPQFYCSLEVAPGARRLLCAYPFPDRQETLFLLPEESCLTDAPEISSLPSDEDIAFIDAQTAKQVTSGQWGRVPPTALIYTPYTGVAFSGDGQRDVQWVPVGTGAIRFMHTASVSLDDLDSWHALGTNFDLAIYSHIPDIVHTAKELVLKMLAYERLREEDFVVPWHACS